MHLSFLLFYVFFFLDEFVDDDDVQSFGYKRFGESEHKYYCIVFTLFFCFCAESAVVFTCFIKYTHM